MACLLLLRLISIFLGAVFMRATTVAGPVLSVHVLLRRQHRLLLSTLLLLGPVVLLLTLDPDTTVTACGGGSNDPRPQLLRRSSCGSSTPPRAATTAITDDTAFNSNAAAGAGGTTTAAAEDEEAASSGGSTKDAILEQQQGSGGARLPKADFPSSKRWAGTPETCTKSKRDRQRMLEATLWALFGVHESPDEESTQEQRSFEKRPEEEHVHFGAGQLQHAVQQEYGRPDVPAVGHTPSNDDRRQWEGLVNAGQVLALATDFDGSLVSSTKARRRQADPQRLGVAPSVPESRPGTTLRRKPRSPPSQSLQEPGIHDVEDTDVKERRNYEELQTHDSTVTSSGSSPQESDSVDTCVTLFAMARKNAEDKKQYDQHMETAVNTYSEGLARVIAGSRLLNLTSSDPCCAEMRTTREAKNQLSCSRRCEKDENGAQGQAVVPSQDLAFRQELLEELIASLDAYEKLMANTPLTQMLLKGISKATFEADLQHVPNSVDNFIPGALQTLVRLKYARIPVTVISHSFSSILISATIRIALHRAVARCISIESAADQPPALPSQRFRIPFTPSTTGLTEEETSEQEPSKIKPVLPKRLDDLPAHVVAGGEETARSSSPPGRNFPDEGGGRAQDRSSATGTVSEASLIKWVDQVLSNIVVRGNALVFRDGISTGLVQRQCVTLGDKRKILLKIKKRRLKLLRKKRRTSHLESKAKPISSPLLPSIKQRLRLPQGSSHSTPEPEKAGLAGVPQREKPAWIIFIGDTLADLPALLAADIGIVLGKPSARMERVLQAAGVVQKPLSYLLNEFKRQAAVRSEGQEHINFSEDSISLQSSAAVTFSSPDLPTEKSHVSSVGRRSGVPRKEQVVPHVNFPESKPTPDMHGRTCRKTPDYQGSFEKTQGFYFLPGVDDGTLSVSASVRPYVIYTTPDWVEIHALLFGSAPVGPSN